MESKPYILLEPRHRTILLALFEQYFPDVEVWAYGSRVNGRAHPGSDLDLVLRSQSGGRIDLEQLELFLEALRESNIPFIVEARDWNRLPESFHKEIAKNYYVFIPSQE